MGTRGKGGVIDDLEELNIGMYVCIDKTGIMYIQKIVIYVLRRNLRITLFIKAVIERGK